MAQVGRLVKAGMGGEDVHDLEQAARSRRNAEERAARRSAEETKKEQEEREMFSAKRPSWGGRGVHALIDDNFSAEESSPVVPRRSDENEARSPIAAYPAEENKNFHKKPTQSSAWAPTGLTVGNKSDTSAQIIEKALKAHEKSQPPVSPSAMAGGGGANAVEQALKLLGDAVAHERQRSLSAEARAARLEVHLSTTAEPACRPPHGLLRS